MGLAAHPQSPPFLSLKVMEFHSGWSPSHSIVKKKVRTGRDKEYHMLLSVWCSPTLKPGGQQYWKCFIMGCSRSQYHVCEQKLC